MKIIEKFTITIMVLETITEEVLEHETVQTVAVVRPPHVNSLSLRRLRGRAGTAITASTDLRQGVRGEALRVPAVPLAGLRTGEWMVAEVRTVAGHVSPVSSDKDRDKDREGRRAPPCPLRSVHVV